MQHENGEILAEAELVWEHYKITGLLAGQMEQIDIFRHHGWETVELDDDGEWLELLASLIGEQDG